MPLPGNGKQRIQPIWADDVAAFFVKALDLDAATNRTLRSAARTRSPGTSSTRGSAVRPTAAARRSTLPLALMRPGAALAELLPKPPVTRDMLKMLEAGDNPTSHPLPVETFGSRSLPLDEAAAQARPLRKRRAAFRRPFNLGYQRCIWQERFRTSPTLAKRFPVVPGTRSYPLVPPLPVLEISK